MSEHSSLLTALLRGPSIEAVFDRLLEKEINIPAGIRQKASTSQNYLRDFLRRKSNSAATFPAVLSSADRDFIGGSFGRKTKRKPLDDIDLYIPLDGQGLVYLDQQGLRLPYTVLTDNSYVGFNPVLGVNWVDGNLVSSAKLVAGFTKAITELYPKQTAVRSNQQAISIQLTIGQTESSDGLGFDVVPCFSLKPDNIFGQQIYLIPDGKNGWLTTNPRIDAEKADTLNAANAQTFRKVVRLIKHWADNASCDFGSYYIELAVAKEYARVNATGVRISCISQGLAFGFSGLSTAVSNGNQSSWVCGALSVVPKSVSLLNSSQLYLATRNAQLAWQREVELNSYESLRIWKEVFGASFSE